MADYNDLADYLNHFDPVRYNAAFNTSVQGDTPLEVALRGIMDLYSQAYSQEIHGECQAGGHGGRLLDIGTGPSLYHLMTASRLYTDITLSDPVPANRQALMAFKEGREDAHDWTDFFMYVAKMENGDSKKWHDVHMRLRSAIHDILPCDVTKPGVLEQAPTPQAPTLKPYDCVTSQLCLEAACRDEETYTDAVKNLVSLVRPGGIVVLGAFLKESWYEFGGKKWHCLPLSIDLIRTSLEAAGCRVVSQQSSQAIDLEDIADLEGYLIIQAVKL